MQSKSGVAVALGRESNEETATYQQSTEPKQFTTTTDIPTTETTLKPRESKLDQVFVAAVYGLTAAFMAFIFGWVTEYISSTFENTLLSAFMGLCIGVIAYALMGGED